MNDYLMEIEFAASKLIPLIWRDRNRLRKLEEKVASLTKQVDYAYLRAESIAMNSEDLDDIGIATGMHWGTYFGADKDRHYKKEELEKLEQQVAVRAFSFDSLAGSLLQFGKQGISLVHGGLSNCPNSRGVGTQFLKEIIWQGRNQAIHWEANNLHAPVQACFEKLKNECDPKFGDYTTRSMAADVVELLGWKTFARFRTDMLSLK
jgi:hypothetical protein